MYGRPLRFAALAVGASVWLGIAPACAPGARTRASGVVLESAAVPVGADTIVGVDWVRVVLPAGETLAAAVARPAAPGRHPVLLVLHGTHGFAREYVALARDLARATGAVAVAACWFAGRRGAGTQFVTPIECPEAPPMPSTGMTPEALAVVGALVEAARALPGVQAERVALLGHSRGAVAALNYALERGTASQGTGQGLRAVVLNSGAYPPELVARVGVLGVPTLLLHGTADSPVGGGSEMTAIGRARLFEGALAGASKVHEVEYFEGAGHETLFTNGDQRTRSVRRVADFLRRYGFE
ncbi:MAG TPA: dienelactone hydrolase family protein [Gemmatimonadaceae bacterium]|nr:dienelactone hydrolase family protein [Gemmatimonadaceae bacterium]